MKEVHTINHIPICDKTARDTIQNHNHDEKYAAKNHVHDERYADIHHKHEEYTSKELVQNIVNNAIAAAPAPEIDLSKYALKTDVPTRVSQLQNNVYYVTTPELSNKEFQALKTENKTIIGAINELYNMIVGLREDFNELRKDFDELPEAPTIISCTNLTLNKSSISLQVGQTSTITATKIPSNTTDTLLWSSSNTGVATVSNGVVVAKAVGSCTIIATCGNKTATCSVTISAATVSCTGVTLTMTSLNLTPGQIVDLAANITPSNCTDDITWTSSNSNVAQVTNISEQKVGRIQAVAPGSCTITIKCGNYSDTCLVTVQSSATGSDEVPCTGITLNLTSTLYLYEGQTYQFKATTSPFACTQRTYWLSSDATIASVSSTGLVTAKSPGDATIMATCGDYTASCKVHVNEGTDPNPTFKEDILYSPHVVRTKDYTYILKEDNTLWESDHTNAYYGSYNFKQRMTDVKKVAGNAEGEFCMVLKNDGTLWAKGKNEYGQLGLGNTTTASGFTQVTTNTDGGVIDVACGDRETMIIKTDYSVWVCGQKCFGLKNESNLASFTRVTDENIIDGSQIKKIVMSGDYTSCFVLKTDGVLWGCGNDGNGQLGSNSNYGGGVEDFIQIPNMTNVKDIVTSENHSVLLKNDGTVWGTGMNKNGALGHNPDNYPSFRVFTQIPNIDNVVQIATGKSHTVALKSDGSLMGTGYYDALGMPMPSSTSWYNNFKNITYGVADPCEIYGYYGGYFYVKEDGSVFKNNSHDESNGPNDYEAGTIDLKIAIK